MFYRAIKYGGHSLRILTALEMNVLFNLMPLFTALLSWLYLGESLITIQIIGMLAVILGVISVNQIRT